MSWCSHVFISFPFEQLIHWKKLSISTWNVHPCNEQWKWLKKDKLTLITPSTLITWVYNLTLYYFFLLLRFHFFYFYFYFFLLRSFRCSHCFTNALISNLNSQDAIFKFSSCNSQLLLFFSFSFLSTYRITILTFVCSILSLFGQLSLHLDHPFDFSIFLQSKVYSSNWSQV